MNFIAEVNVHQVQSCNDLFPEGLILVTNCLYVSLRKENKVFTDRCTPWCNTHEPRAKLSSGKKGYVIALRTGSSMPECEKIMGSIAHFYGPLEIELWGKLGLCSIEYKEDIAVRIDEIKQFCIMVLNS